MTIGSILTIDCCELLCIDITKDLTGMPPRIPHKPTQSGDITHIAHVDIDINGHTEKQIFYITNLGKYDIILGKPWLSKHNPHIDWAENAVTFNSNYCRTRCLKKDCFQLHVKGSAALSIVSSS